MWKSQNSGSSHFTCDEESGRDHSEAAFGDLLLQLDLLHLADVKT
jgi:hypothetical protein